MVIDHSADTFLHRCAGQLFDRLDFDHEALIDEEVDSEGNVEMVAFVFERDGELPRDLQSTRFQPSCKDGFINRFEKTRPEVSMQRNRLINDDPADLIDR